MIEMGLIPTEAMLHELAIRYENLIVCGAKAISEENATSLCFAHGHTITALGLTHVMQNFLTREFDGSLGPEVEDIP